MCFCSVCTLKNRNDRNGSVCVFRAKVDFLSFLLGGLALFTLTLLYMNASLIIKSKSKTQPTTLLETAVKSAIHSETTGDESKVAADATAAEEPSQTRNLNKYREIHEKIMSGQLPLKLSINGLDYNGYANRLYSVITSFVLAVLTDSALIVHWQEVSAFIHEPFKDTFRNFTGLDTEFNFNYKRAEVYNFSWTGNAWHIKKDAARLVQTEVPTNEKRVFYYGIEAQFFSICANPVYYDKLHEYGLVDKSTIDHARDVMQPSSNATSEDKAAGVLQVGFDVGGNFLRKLWRPKSTMRSLIDHFYNTFFKGNYVIGMQLRTEFLKGYPNASKIFTDCAFDLEHELAATSVKWFVTSDSQPIIDMIRTWHPSRVIVVNGSIEHIGLGAKSAYLKSILDHELLTLCNQTIITGPSSYGFVASMKAGRMPYYVRGLNANETKCRKANFNDPPSAPNVGCF